MSGERPALHALAERLGILPVYRDVEGHDRHTSDGTREALVAAMGHDASDEAAASAALERLDREARERLVEPVLVWREWAEGSPMLAVNGEALGGGRDYEVELLLEDGYSETKRGRVSEDHPGVFSVPLPRRPAPGYHELRIAVDAPGGERRAVQRLVMVPRTVLQPEEVLGEGPAFGVCSNLYTVRAPGDWGHGGLRELARLGRVAGEAGAAFVGINPLHAVTNRGLDFSPYSPSSRLFRNVLYLDPEAVPELAASAEARALLDEPSLRQRRAALEGLAQIDHEAVLELMLPVLRALHGTFGREAAPARRQAYAAYQEREGAALVDFATWETLVSHHAEGTAWWRWPEPLRDPRSPAVEAFRVEHADEVGFRCWLQFELDRQLGEAADAVRGAGCDLGIYQDLALGSSTDSADTWMAPRLFATGVHVGAPPDAYAPEGQDWGFPPFDPHRLRADAYRPWSRLLRAAFAHTGALRIDHAMGLLRLFWIPEGRRGTDGAYVSYRVDDLLGVLALESRRHGCVVVAEDLGTLPPELPGLLADWGLLRSAVVYFERDEGGHFRPPDHYPPRALATVNTHDLAPLAGYFDGRDLLLRQQVGGYASEEAFEAARSARADERTALVERLREQQLLSPVDMPADVPADVPAEDPPDGGAAHDDVALRDAVHAFLSRTPSILAGVSLDDLAGESEPVNVPGVPLTAQRSWSRRMGRALDDLAPDLPAALEPLRERFRRPAPRR